MSSVEQKRKSTKHNSKFLHKFLDTLEHILKIMYVLKAIFEFFH